MGVELLAPAGSFESMQAAFSAGADAVYIGGSRFGARAYADNLSEDLLKQAIDNAHILGKKLYLTVNTLLKEEEIVQLYEFLLPLYEEGLDAVIVQDFGVFRYLRDVFPELPIHASTQMGITGANGAELLKNAGAVRIVPARELSLEEIRNIKQKVNIEIECFVHGALCYCYSGQCLFSSMLGGRSGNRGRCAQPCRLPYSIGGEQKYYLSPKDICTLKLIPELIHSGIDSFKIEGRMKSPEYTAGVTRIYRKYIDLYYENKYERVKEQDYSELLTLFNRMGFSEGYFKTHNGPKMMASERPMQTDEKKERQKQAEREQLHQTLREAHLAKAPEKKINGKLTLLQGKSAILTVSDGTQEITVSGDEVQLAMKRPLLLEDVEKRMRKTGGTGFSFEELNVQMEDSIFLPVQSLNELRRKALDEFRDVILENERRAGAKYRKPVDSSAFKQTFAAEAQQQPYLAVSVENLQFGKAVAKVPEVSVIYLDCTAFYGANFITAAEEVRTACHAAGKKCGYIFPWIFRAEAENYCKNPQFIDAVKKFDVILLRNPEEIEFVKKIGYDGEIRADWNLYSFNNEARYFFKEKKLTGDTVSPELNKWELRKRGCSQSELIVYGYQPLMVSAQCQVKNTKGCTKCPQILYLKDRKRKQFAVKNQCMFCYNVIYNSVPLVLYDQTEEILKLQPEGIRLSFTTEKKSEIREILDRYITAFYDRSSQNKPVGEFTRGHFERGVE